MARAVLEPRADREIFVVPLKVRPEHIDENGHVNNVVYVGWLQDAGTAHWNDRFDEATRTRWSWVGTRHDGVDVLQDEGLRDGIKTFSDWPTIPQLYVKGEFVGGSDIVREMFNAGELQALMAEKGVPLGEQAEA